MIFSGSMYSVYFFYGIRQIGQILPGDYYKIIIRFPDHPWKFSCLDKQVIFIQKNDMVMQCRQYYFQSRSSKVRHFFSHRTSIPELSPSLAASAIIEYSVVFPVALSPAFASTFVLSSACGCSVVTSSSAGAGAVEVLSLPLLPHPPKTDVVNTTLNKIATIFLTF